MSLYEAQLQVKDFMEAADQACPNTPTVPSLAVAALRHRLMQEELQEFVTAVTRDTLAGHVYNPQEVLTAVADALADLLYVTLGTGVAFGIDLAPVFEAVHASNMTKFIDGHKREDGKYLRGPSYRPPYIAQIIGAQMD